MKSFVLAASIGFLGPSLVLGQALTEEQKKATVSWIQSVQKENGGFAADKRPKTPATMRATAAALRALKLLAAQPTNKDSCARFVMSCYNKVLTGYAPQPGGKVDKATTAFGLMAAGELKLPDETYMVRPVIFLCSCVKKIEDIQLTAAAYEAVHSKCELAQDWIVTLQDTQNPDGTFGKGDNPAGVSAAAMVALRRLGGQVRKTEQVLKTLKTSQQSDGGWGKKGAASDLETTYRVIQAMVYFKDKPDSKACLAFVARCRHDDGSYGLRPGDAGSSRATYFAAALLHWLNEKKK